MSSHACVVSHLLTEDLLLQAFRDPGILPRNLDPDPPYPAEASRDSEMRVALPRELRVRAGM